MKYNFFTIDDDIYPKKLKEIDDPPQKIYYLGNLDLLKEEKIISVVGTRKASDYGKICCEKIVSELVRENILIVSGFASGIDTISHETALNNNGKTIAIMPCGIDIVYPARNINLWKKISEKGLILSEFEIGVKPYKQNFPLRNRIIAGISSGTLVVESKEKGGSLITANLALEYNRDVFAIPGDIFSENSRGCNLLIKKSEAKLVSNAEEILEEYDWEIKNKNDEEENLEDLTEIQKKILNILSREKNLDEILGELDIEIDLGSLLSELMQLEILKKIKSISGGKYKRII